MNGAGTGVKNLSLVSVLYWQHGLCLGTFCSVNLIARVKSALASAILVQFQYGRFTTH